MNKRNDDYEKQELQVEREDELNFVMESSNDTDEMPCYLDIFPNNIGESKSRNTTREWPSERINDRIKALRELIPGCDKVDEASIIDDAIKYIQTLQKLHLQMTCMRGSMSQEAYMTQVMYQGMIQMPPPIFEPARSGILASQSNNSAFASSSSTPSLVTPLRGFQVLPGMMMMPQFQVPFTPQFSWSTAYTMVRPPSLYATPTMSQGSTIIRGSSLGVVSSYFTTPSSISNPTVELLQEHKEACDYGSGQGVQGETSNSASNSRTDES